MLKTLKIASFSLPGIVHGFGTRGLTLKEIENNFKGYRVLQLKQVHSAKILVEKEGEGDGLITKTRGTLLVLKTADCLPIFIGQRQGKVVAALHGGWRGLCKGIIPEAVKKLDSMGFPPEDLVAALGPSIGGCCYEVGEEVFKCFEENNLPSFRRGNFLDLQATASLHLRLTGISEVHSLPLCTRCHPWLFYSYRGGDLGKRMFSFTGLVEIK